jgi:beta-glucuronidase
VQAHHRLAVALLADEAAHTGGIELPSCRPVALDDLGVMPRLRCSGPEGCSRPVVQVSGALRGLTARRGTRVTIRVTLRSPTGATTTRVLTTSAPPRGHSHPLSFSFPLSGAPDLWSPDHPALYATTVVTRAGRTTAQLDELHVGVRAVEVKGGLLYLNGRRVQLRGASIQEDMPGRGPALRPADIDTIVSELKDVGANVTRAQYGLSDELMSGLDRAGIMLWNQAPVYHRDLELRHPSGRGEALAQVRDNILAARNHPSLLANSVDNEPIAQPDSRRGTREFLFRASRIARRLDPVTPVALDIAAKPGIRFERTFTWFSLLGLNSYFGWYTGRPGTSVANFNDFEPLLQLMRKSYPEQGLLVTEFGAEASFSDPAGARKGSYEFQSQYVSKSLDVIDATPFLGGAIYWTLREFAVKPHWDGGAGLPVAQRNSLHHKGLLAYDGTPKRAYFVARQRFESTPLYVPAT